MLRQLVTKRYLYRTVFDNDYLDVRNPSKMNVVEFMSGRQFRKQYKDPQMFTNNTIIQEYGIYIGFNGEIPIHIPSDATVKITHKDSKILVDRVYYE